MKEEGKKGRRVGALPGNPLRMLDSKHPLRGENLTTQTKIKLTQTKQKARLRLNNAHTGDQPPSHYNTTHQTATKENKEAKTIQQPRSKQELPSMRITSFQQFAPCPIVEAPGLICRARLVASFISTRTPP